MPKAQHLFDRYRRRGYQSRWGIYVITQNRGPEPSKDERTLVMDNIDFISWIGDQWREWKTLKGLPINSPNSERMHQEFDAWLYAKYITAGEPQLAMNMEAPNA